MTVASRAFMKFQHTAARRRLASSPATLTGNIGFNTQPPEGGWEIKIYTLRVTQSFNTQPPEGGWLIGQRTSDGAKLVSTHSRPKAAGPRLPCWIKP